MRKFCPDISAIRAASGPASPVVRVGVARAFVSGQLQAGQRVGGQVFFGEIARVIQVEQVQSGAEAAQQVTAVIAPPGPHDHLRPGIGACLGQRQHDPVDDGTRACAGLAASSSASMITLNRARCASGQRVADRRGQVLGLAGSAADAARAISSATSSAVLPLACTAQLTDPGLASTPCHRAAATARIEASAVVTTRPRTADLPTPGEPVTTSTRRSGRGRSSQATIRVSAAVRPRNRQPRSLSMLTPRARGRQCRDPFRVAGQRPAPLGQRDLPGRRRRPAGQRRQLLVREVQVRLIQRDGPAVTVGVRLAHDSHHGLVVGRPQARHR